MKTRATTAHKPENVPTSDLNYLTKTPFFNAHPPLSQYLIGLGIWIGSHIPFWQNSLNSLTGSLLSSWSYRWVNALIGSLIPVIAIFLSYQLSYRRGFALLAGLFTALDGLFLVESRYALSNIYIVLFGLLGQWFLFLALEKRPGQKLAKLIKLLVAGISFGASLATKWNGLWFLLGVYVMWIVGWIIRWLQPGQNVSNHGLHQESNEESRVKTEQDIVRIPLAKITQINIWQMGFFLGIIPLITYSLIWIPHLQLDVS